jgi:hypothetical protein
MSDLDTETTSETVTFTHFDREWTVPAKRHLSHIREIKAEMRRGLVPTDDFLAELFLDDEQFSALLKIDPPEDDMDAFGTALAKAMGVGDQGNS